MITIKQANKEHSEVLSLLGTLTYKESHGHFISDKDDLRKYLETAFSVNKTNRDLINSENLFYIIYADQLPVGYAKLQLNSSHNNIAPKQSCQLERIYILNDFIPLKIGQQFLTFLEDKAIELKYHTMWLSVYKENKRAISFYQKNGYEKVKKSTFVVNGTGYDNIVFSKNLHT